MKLLGITVVLIFFIFLIGDDGKHETSDGYGIFKFFKGKVDNLNKTLKNIKRKPKVKPKKEEKKITYWG